MPDYHLHEVKRDGSIAKRSVVLKCRDDDEAIRQAWQLREGRRRRGMAGRPLGRSAPA
jgi:hypothetical protein